MADSIRIHCVKCSRFIAEISHVPGKQILGCSNCNTKTVAKINEQGHLETYRYTGDDGCHITKVVCYSMGLPDNCHQLTQIRRFRDEYLYKYRFENEVKEYYENSVKYSELIQNEAAKNPNIYNYYYEKYITPAVYHIEKNEMENAHLLLKEYLDTVKLLK